MRYRHRLQRSAVAFLAIALVASACGGDGGGGGEGGGGETISLLHGISGQEEQAALQQAIDAFEEQSDHTVEIEASPDFETQIVTRVQGQNAPDVALYPQPGLLERLVENATPLEEVGVDVGSLEGDLVEGMVDTATFDGETYGIVVKVGMKSLLWYAADDLESEGYEVPETWEDMKSTSEQIASDLEGEAGRAPWCIGIESSEATGWVATDWIEDIVLRMHGPDVYDQWVSHEIEFSSDEIRSAFEELESIWFEDTWVVGGTTGILQTPFGDAPAPMFNDPAGCYFHRQAGFITGNFPEDAELGTDYDVTQLPPMEEEGTGGNPVLFAGDVAAVHTDSEAAGELVSFLASTEGQEAWMSHEGAGSLSARTDFDSSQYPTEALAQQGDLLAEAEVARFDASDQMPGEVGAGAFWDEVVSWISGGQDLDTTLSNIDSAWPEDADAPPEPEGEGAAEGEGEGEGEATDEPTDGATATEGE